jgi:serine/threonine protein kinase
MEGTKLPRIINARYRLDAVLGEGGMGVVYRAFDLSVERPVAVKVMRADAKASPDDAKRFLREVRATAEVKSVHSVTLFDVGQNEEGDPFLVMNLVEGESLHAVLVRERAISAERACAIALQVCVALGAAHAVGIIHRDVKPANIMLTQRGADELVTVLDFGVAKRMDQATALTATGYMVGTLEYMAPEQIAGEAIDGRIDQYALAATIIRMISGESLFTGVGLASLVHHKLMTVPVSLCNRAPTAPRALDAVLRRALEKKPDARYADIAAFAEAVGVALTTRDADVITVVATTSEATVRDAVSPSARPEFGVVPERELALAGNEMQFELDAPVPSAPRPPPESLIAHAVALVVPPPQLPVVLEAPPFGVMQLLAPGVWKRVLLYSALALLLGNACIRGFSTTSTVVLALGIALAASALVLHARLARKRM